MWQDSKHCSSTTVSLMASSNSLVVAHTMAHSRTQTVIIRKPGPAKISIWKEAFFGAELLLLHASPVYYGFGVPPGDGSGVVVIPGFLGTDEYLQHLNG